MVLRRKDFYHREHATVFAIALMLIAFCVTIFLPDLYIIARRNIQQSAQLPVVVSIDYASYSQDVTADLATKTLSITTHVIEKQSEGKIYSNFSPAQTPPTGFGIPGYQSYSGPKFISTCVDCTFYPVGKSYALAASYAPKVVESGLTGGGELTLETKNAMVKLFADLRAKGFKPRLNSAYRSYQTQLSTFNYAVEQEVRKGKSRSEAETIANRRSARPGHSEHQLGTTADIACDGCDPYDKSKTGNDALWAYMQDNIHKFGFVVSYTPDKEGITGYVYEPWHVRFVGVDLATEMYQRKYWKSNNKETLEKFLVEKDLY